jgi:hypothetical protein
VLGSLVMCTTSGVVPACGVLSLAANDSAGDGAAEVDGSGVMRGNCGRLRGFGGSDSGSGISVGRGVKFGGGKVFAGIGMGTIALLGVDKAGRAGTGPCAGGIGVASPPGRASGTDAELLGMARSPGFGASAIFVLSPSGAATAGAHFVQPVLHDWHDRHEVQQRSLAMRQASVLQPSSPLAPSRPMVRMKRFLRTFSSLSGWAPSVPAVRSRKLDRRVEYRPVAEPNVRDFRPVVSLAMAGRISKAPRVRANGARWRSRGGHKATIGS